MMFSAVPRVCVCVFVSSFAVVLSHKLFFVVVATRSPVVKSRFAMEESLDLDPPA